ncbi:MAG: hypothetical protein MI975_11160 [Cytophagales bacterium]|nr:hypothetical protein [Cytophagales bacterium]
MESIRLIIKGLVLLIFLYGISSCDEKGDPQGPINLNDEQTASVSMRGKWGQASDPDLPFGTTEGVLDDLILEFRITDDYYPSDFSASGADYFFSTGNEGSWNWEGDKFEIVTLANVVPITVIQVVKEASEIRVTFIYEGDEGGRTSGTGEYSVTLKKIAP